MEKYGDEQSSSLLNVSQWAVRPSHKDDSIHKPSPLLKEIIKFLVFLLLYCCFYPPPIINFSWLTNKNSSLLTWCCRLSFSCCCCCCPTQEYFICFGVSVNKKDSPKPKYVLLRRSDQRPAQNAPNIYSKKTTLLNSFLRSERILFYSYRNYLAISCFNNQYWIFNFINLL